MIWCVSGRYELQALKSLASLYSYRLKLAVDNHLFRLGADSQSLENPLISPD